MLTLVISAEGYVGRSLPLPVSAPFHCSLMNSAAEVMAPALNAVKFQEPDIEVISNVTARPVRRLVYLLSYSDQ